MFASFKLMDKKRLMLLPTISNVFLHLACSEHCVHVNRGKGGVFVLQCYQMDWPLLSPLVWKHGCF